MMWSLSYIITGSAKLELQLFAWIRRRLLYILLNINLRLKSPHQLQFLGNEDMVICVLKFKGKQSIIIVWMCVCMDPIVCFTVSGTF